jgi:hypothetical protein
MVIVDKSNLLKHMLAASWSLKEVITELRSNNVAIDQSVEEDLIDIYSTLNEANLTIITEINEA